MPPEDAYLFLNRYVNIPRDIFDRLALYHDLLLKWQPKINLVSNESLQEVWKRHFLDSLQLLPLLPKTPMPIIDIGTGAGFPGMVLAIAGTPSVHLVESDGKKISFLQEVKRITQTDVTIHHERIEESSIGTAAVIVARAVSELNQLLAYASPHVSHETICLFPKGKNYAKELDDAMRNWSFKLRTVPSVTEQEAVILQLSSIERRPV